MQNNNTVYLTSGLATASRTPPPTMSNRLKNAFASANVDESDLLYLHYPLVHEGVNLNGDEFLAEEMHKAYKSLVGTPLDKDHGRLCDDVVGKHFSAELSQDNGKLAIFCDAYIYANLYPDLVVKLMDGAINGVSMETTFTSARRVSANVRQLLGLRFIGAGLVRIPADPEAILQVKAAKHNRDDLRAVAAQIARILQEEKS